jgi:hypothetical protein
MFLVMPRSGLDAVRRTVLSQLSGSSIGVGVSLVGGIVTMKAIACAVAVVLLAGASWVLWPAPQDTAAQPIAEIAASSPTLVETPAENLVGSARRSKASDETPTPPGQHNSPTPVALPMLTVRVVLEHSREPVAEIGVRLLRAAGSQALDRRRIVTGEDGEARLRDLPAGVWSATTDRGGNPVVVDLTAGGPATAELTLSLGVNLEGRVLDEFSEPVPGAAIWLSARAADFDDGEIVATTDEGGWFGIAHTEPGRLVAAVAEGYLSSHCVEVMGKPGTTQTLELSLASGGCALRGEVVDSSGSPVSHAPVMAGYARRGGFRSQEPTRPGARTWTDQAGRFELFGIPEGFECPVWARAAGFAPRRESVSIRAPETRIRIELLHGATLRGRVRAADGSPVVHERVAVFQFAVEPGKGMAWQGPAWGRPEAITDAQGHFQVTEIVPGQVRLSVHRDRSAAVQLFDLADEEEEYWDAILQPPPAIVGVLLEETGAPLGGWDVWASADVKGIREPGWGRTDAAGRFHLEPCDDVTYVLKMRAAGSGMHSGDHTVPDVRPDPDILEVIVPVGRIASAEITGVVRDAGGPVTDSLFVVMEHILADGSREYAGNEPRFEGERFFVGPVVPGRYKVRVGRRDLGAGIDLGEFEVEAEGTLDVGVRTLPEPGWVSLQVTDTDGEPLTENMFLIKQPGSRYGAVVRVTGGSGTSKGLAPGSYVTRPFGGSLPLMSKDVEVRTGETTIVSIIVPHSVTRRVRFPPMNPEDQVEVIWRNADDKIVSSGSGTYPSPTGYEKEVAVVPGTYEVELSLPSGASARATFLIEDRMEPEALLEMPDPWQP